MELIEGGVFIPDCEQRKPKAEQARFSWHALTVREKEEAMQRTSVRHKGTKEPRWFEYGAELCALAHDRFENVTKGGEPLPYPDGLSERRAFWLSFRPSSIVDEYGSAIAREQSVDEAERRD